MSDEDSSTENNIVHYSDPVIDELDETLLYEGDSLVIKGQNFFCYEECYLQIDNDSYDYSNSSDDEIIFEIPLNFESGSHQIRVIANGGESDLKLFSYLNKGWSKIKESGNILKAIAFDDSKELIFIEKGHNSDYGFLYRLVSNYNYYSESLRLNYPVYTNSLLKIGDTLLVANNTAGYLKTSDNFENYLITGSPKTISLFYNYQVDPLFFDSTTVFLSNIYGAFKHFKNEEIINESENFEFLRKCNEAETSCSIRGHILSAFKTNSGDIYKFGFLNSSNTEYNYSRNLILKTHIDNPNHYQVLDSITQDNGGKMRGIKFLNAQKIYSVSGSTLYKSTNLCQTWEVELEDIVFISFKSDSEWYAQFSDGKLYHTTNSGSSWNIELEFDEELLIQNINYSSNKIVLATDKGIYLKLF